MLGNGIVINITHMETDFGLVSIIMPSYNSSKYIAKTIDSIVSQFYTNWELLITDDCSTDNTCEIIKGYAAYDQRIKLFVMEENKGAGVARNKSIEEAKGRYIAFCDSDDRWKPEKLEVQLRFMVENRVEICYSSYLKCNENDKVFGIVIAPSKISYKKMTRNDYIGFLTCIYDTHQIGKIYMPTLRKRQDWAWKILLMKKCPIAYGIKDTLAYYRVREGSLSNNKMKLIRYNVTVYKQILKYNTVRAWATFLCVFLPNYLLKKCMTKLVNR